MDEIRHLVLLSPKSANSRDELANAAILAWAERWLLLNASKRRLSWIFHSNSVMSSLNFRASDIMVSNPFRDRFRNASV